MRKGDQPKAVSEVNVPPLFSCLTLKVCAAQAVGYEFVKAVEDADKSKAFCDATELVDGKPRREVSWVFLVNEPVEFKLPNGTRERVTFEQFWERLDDEAWIEANPDHPIAYQAATIRQVHGMQWKLRAKRGEHHELYGEPLGRTLLLRKEGNPNRRCYLPFDATPEERAEILTKLGWT